MKKFAGMWERYQARQEWKQVLRELEHRASMSFQIMVESKPGSLKDWWEVDWMTREQALRNHRKEGAERGWSA